MTNGQLALIGGGVALVGGYFWWRSHQSGAAFGAIPMYPTGYATDGSLRYAANVPVSGPTQGFQPGPTVELPTAPGIGGTLGKVGTGAATAIGTAALGPGSIATAALTAGIGGAAAVLTWAIAAKGLFRGGEVGVLVNPARDQFLLQFGPGGTGPDSGFGRLAAALSEITGEPNGSHYFQALIGATSKEQLIAATQDIQAVLATQGIRIGAFEG